MTLILLDADIYLEDSQWSSARADAICPYRLLTVFPYSKSLNFWKKNNWPPLTSPIFVFRKWGRSYFGWFYISVKLVIEKTSKVGGFIFTFTYCAANEKTQLLSGGRKIIFSVINSIGLVTNSFQFI